MLTESVIVDLSRRYAAATNVAMTTLSYRVFNDTKKIAALDGGAGISLERFNNALQWFSNHWPANAEWPDEVPRPDSTKQEVAAQ